MFKAGSQAHNPSKNKYETKVGCAFPMVISSDFRKGKHRDDDHEEDAPYLVGICFRIYSSLLNERWSSRSCEDDGAPCCDVLPESGPGQIECSCVVENQEINHIIKGIAI